MKTIYLKNRKNLPYFTMVDDDDFNKFNKYNWQFLIQGIHSKSLYAVRKQSINKIKRTFYLHREIMNAKKGQFIDHTDRNGLNNQKSNLRFCTLADNSHNRIGWNKKKSSKYKGVTFNKRNKKWSTLICINNKNKFIGYYDTEKEASVAYNKEAKKLHKAFYKLEQL